MGNPPLRLLSPRVKDTKKQVLHIRGGTGITDWAISTQMASVERRIILRSFFRVRILSFAFFCRRAQIMTLYADYGPDWKSLRWRLGLW